MLNFPGNLRSLIGTQQGIQPLVICRVQGVNDGLGQLVCAVPGIHQSVQSGGRIRDRNAVKAAVRPFLT